MSYDTDNVIQVEVRDLTTGEPIHEFVIDYVNNRNPVEVEQMRMALLEMEVQ
jgi:hypothetical protein